MPRGQLSLEFLAFLLLAALMLAAGLVLWKEGLAGVERAGMQRNAREISGFLEFASRSGGRLSENFTLFPTARANLFVSGGNATVRLCGRFSGGIASASAPVGGLPDSGSASAPCSAYPHSGRISVTVGRGSVEIADIN